MLACFGIELCVVMIKGQDSLLFVFLAVGVLGGFSTFSTFSLEVLKLLQNHFIFTAMLYMLLSNVCGILCVYLGYLFKG
ncbi:CrcB family protein [Campylobacter upsaliensis]